MTIVTGWHLKDFLIECGVDPARVVIFPDDELYSLPSIEGLEISLPYVREQLNKHVGLYDAEDADCDDFAKACDVVFKEIHRKTENHPDRTSLAFGVFEYGPDDGPKHALNFAVVNQGGRLKLLFIEPQTCGFVNLSREQVSTCYAANF